MAQGDGKTPGNGSSNPFGNGQGQASGSRAAPFDPTAQSNPQRPMSESSFPTQQVPAGGKTLFADPNGGSIRQAQIGTTAGNNRSPFRVRGS
ncbi:MAG: hypothetical protein E6Q97_24190 [Desulfurellales bacterium]|nr:MAG: hypothetical protein E6Q97_24190 [Desulfurellales bacterium]